MDQWKDLRLRINVSTIADIARIAQEEDRPRSEVIRLLIRTGLRAYRRGRPLLCGYPNCTRKDCCGGERKAGEVVEFPRVERDH